MEIEDYLRKSECGLRMITCPDRKTSLYVERAENGFKPDSIDSRYNEKPLFYVVQEFAF